MHRGHVGDRALLQGTITEERLPKEATVQLAMTMGTSVGGEASQVRRSFLSVDRAQEGIYELAGSSSAAAVQLYESTARVQAMTGQVCHTSSVAFLYIFYHDHKLRNQHACYAMTHLQVYMGGLFLIKDVKGWTFGLARPVQYIAHACRVFCSICRRSS